MGYRIISHNIAQISRNIAQYRANIAHLLTPGGRGAAVRAPRPAAGESGRRDMTHMRPSGDGVRDQRMIMMGVDGARRRHCRTPEVKQRGNFSLLCPLTISDPVRVLSQRGLASRKRLRPTQAIPKNRGISRNIAKYREISRNIAVTIL